MNDFCWFFTGHCVWRGCLWLMRGNERILLTNRVVDKKLWMIFGTVVAGKGADYWIEFETIFEVKRPIHRNLPEFRTEKNRYSIHFGRLSGFGKNHQIPSSNYAARLFGRTRNIHEIYRSCILSKYHWIYFAFVKLKRRCVVKIVFINSSVFIYDFSDHKICAAVCCCFCRCCAVRWPNAKHFQSKTKIYKMN